MNVAPDLQQLIDERVSSGQYATPDDVLRAALASLQQQESFGDFKAGELDALLAEGEQSIHREGTIEGDAVFREIRDRSAARRRDSK